MTSMVQQDSGLVEIVYREEDCHRANSCSWPILVIIRAGSVHILIFNSKFFYTCYLPIRIQDLIS